MWIRTFFVAFVGVLLAGCGGGGGMTKAQSNLHQIGTLYGRFMAQNKGKPPANEAQFKDFIKKVEPKLDLDQLFISPRDQQPYVLKYNIKGAGIPDPTKSAPIVAHEKVGVNGKVQVSRSIGPIDEIDAASIK